MKPKVLPILEIALTEGINYGWVRAHKHNENPGEAIIKENIQEQIMNSLYEYFDFEVETNV